MPNWLVSQLALKNKQQLIFYKEAGFRACFFIGSAWYLLCMLRLLKCLFLFCTDLHCC